MLIAEADWKVIVSFKSFEVTFDLLVWLKEWSQQNMDSSSGDHS